MFLSNRAFLHHDSDEIKVLSGRDVSVHIKPHIPSSRPGPNKSFIWSQEAMTKWLTIGHVSAMWQSIILVWLIQVQTPKELCLTVRVRCWDNQIFSRMLHTSGESAKNGIEHFQESITLWEIITQGVPMWKLTVSASRVGQIGLIHDSSRGWIS